MNKKLRKLISTLLPKGRAKEMAKLLYYNLISKGDVKFTMEKGNIYVTDIQGYKLKTHQAMYFVVNDLIQYQSLYTIKEGDVVLDAGANIGQLSLYFAHRVGSKGHVFSFEPDNFNITIFEKNIALNSLNDRITLNEKLLWNATTELDFFESGTPGSSAHWKPSPDKLVKKKTVTIDNWIKEQGIKKLDFVKMDIEGAEIEALEGCITTMKTMTPNFAIASYHWVDGKQTYLWVEDFFKKHNYPVRTLRFGKNEIITFAGPGSVI